MASIVCAITCLCLPCQSGKTGKVEDMIKNMMQIQKTHGDENASLNIWISTNNKTLANQTATRFTKNVFPNRSSNESCVSSLQDEDDAAEPSNDCVKNEVYSWTSGSKASNISPETLAYRISRNKVKMVMICAHPKRIKHMSDCIDYLSDDSTFADNKTINIWIDEADKTMSIWKKFVEKMQTNRLVTKIMLVSATIDPIVKKYQSVQVIAYPETYPSCYRGLVDFEKVTVENPRERFTLTGYISDILTQHPHLCFPGKRAFIPGTVNRDTHEKVSKLLKEEFGFAVIILNGDKKEIRFPDGREPFNLSPFINMTEGKEPIEFNETLAQLYVDLKLGRYPLAITGYLCVQRGITFQTSPSPSKLCDNVSPQGAKRSLETSSSPSSNGHSGFLFDYGIIPNISCNADAYQLMARLFGNIGHFSNYAPATIYSSMAMFNKVQMGESTAMNLAKMVYTDGLESVTMSTLKQARTFNNPLATEYEVKSVPVVVHLTEEEYRRIEKRGTKWDLAKICEVIAPHNAEVVRTIREMEQTTGVDAARDHIDQPREVNNPYKQFVTDNLAAAYEGRPFYRSSKNPLRECRKDMYQINLDKFGHNVIVGFYMGSKKVCLTNANTAVHSLCSVDDELCNFMNNLVI